ncbi:MAG: ZIP family metal transporter [Bryobacteraceae bacterium]
MELATTQPVTLAFLAAMFTWSVTALGAALVFLTRSVKPRLLDTLNGFAAGVMIAASFWSLLAPAIAMSEAAALPAWFPASAGFLAGGITLWGADKILPHLHPGLSSHEAEGPATDWQRSVLLVLAITLHNIPEGLAVGVAFGAAATGYAGATVPAAMALTLGIGLQNFPEGVAVAMPLRREGLPAWKCFWYGQLSAIVEPMASVVGALAVLTMHAILPYALSFAAGAMIFVVVEELIPSSQRSGNTDLATLGTLAGFTVMMILDVGFG